MFFVSRTKFLFAALVILVIVVLGIAIPLSIKGNSEEDVSFKNAAVTSNGKECANIGKDVLLKGGTVADAAIATLFCEGVACTQCMGLGGGFLLTMYNKSNGMIRVLDAREVAPAAAHEGMFEGGLISTTVGGMAAAVPGEVKGYEALHREYGSIEWAELIEPTINLCREGIIITEYFARVLKEREDKIKNEPSLSEIFINPKTNSVWVEGDKMIRLKLAETLEVIAREGANALYNGSLTETFVADIQAAKGIITVEDMQKYKPTWHEPVSVDIGSEMTMHTIPLPGSGHQLAFIVNALKEWAFKPGNQGQNDVIHWQRVVEIFKYAYAKRTGLGDPNFLPDEHIQPILKNLTSMEFVKYIRSLIEDDKTYNDWKHYGADFELVEDHGTAHVSILGPNGDAIAVTSTVNFILGAFFRSRSTGIILNNEMDDFSYSNITNIYDIPASPANFAKPGKKPLSSMVPTIITQGQKGVKFIVGAAGGTKIPTQVALVILKHLISGEPLAKVMDEPRLHHQLFPMSIQHESEFDESVLAGLRKIGHNTTELSPTAGFAALTAISVDFQTGLMTPRFDKRRKGSVAGF